jgi:hypothetical protein
MSIDSNEVARPVLVEVETAVDRATAAAESIRWFNHATIHRNGLTVPEVYTITANLAALAFRLRQSCDQIAAIVEHRFENGGLTVDDGSNPGGLIAKASAELRFAGAHAHDLGSALSATQNLLAMIGDR